MPMGRRDREENSEAEARHAKPAIVFHGGILPRFGDISDAPEHIPRPAKLPNGSGRRPTLRRPNQRRPGST